MSKPVLVDRIFLILDRFHRKNDYKLVDPRDDYGSVYKDLSGIDFDTILEYMETRVIQLCESNYCSFMGYSNKRTIELLNLFKQMTLNGFNPKNRIISFA